MKYDTILFDLDNTLWDFNYSEKLSLSEFFIQKNLDKNKLEKYIKNYKIINKKLWEQLENSKITREELVNTRFFEFFKTLGINIDGKLYSNEYEKIIGSHGEIILGADKLLKSLKEKGYRIFAVTNGIYNIQKSRLKNSIIGNFFEEVFISEKVGFVKPDVNYFNTISKSIYDLKKEKTILIGDSLSADIKGANNFEIDSIWYNPNDNILEKIANPTFIVKNYEDILKILK